MAAEKGTRQNSTIQLSTYQLLIGYSIGKLIVHNIFTS
jgi:hypothetical protein